jgi:anti-anti-sigma factor
MTQLLEQKTSREKFDISIDIQARVIGLVGAVDIATAPLLLAAATSLFGLHPGDLTLDLAAVTFADSALLKVIDELTGRLNVDLRLINATAAVKRLFLAGGATHLLRDTPAVPV